MRLLTLFLLLLGIAQAAPDTAKPWTRWWWLGSGVDAANITRELEAFAAAGIGGVEICPIYGAKGYEDRDLEFLSKEWTAMLAHTAKECERLGLGLDLTTGTGWPFGGPWVGEAEASRGLQRVREDLPAGPVDIAVPAGRLECLVAYSENGDALDLASKVVEGRLKWQSPGPVRIRGIVTKGTIQNVKRAAPGGAGPVVDPFSPDAVRSYLGKFDAPLKSLSAPQPRAHFHDSFEYYGADWTAGLLDAFLKDHGYDLRQKLPAFMGEGDAADVAKVARDYRATLDGLHHAYLKAWHDWAASHGSLTRNQAHGSPGNLLDHYAVADIPETEIFRHVAHEQIPMLKFATSAAHLTGRNLVSAESFTWLGEHFQVTPAALKEAADFLWLGGVNHLFFHGIPYSPADAPWPGWLFYASTHMGPHGGLWRDLPAFNRYIHSVQSALQSGSAETTVLLYWPVHDIWSKPADKLPLLTMHNQNEWLHGTSFHRTAMTLWENGIACDFTSDRLLDKASVDEDGILIGKSRFRILLIPELSHLPDSTAAQLGKLAAAGARIHFLGNPPANCAWSTQVRLEAEDTPPAVLDVLAAQEIRPEPMTAAGIRFTRRVTKDGLTWFLVNTSKETIDDFVTLAAPFTSALFIDPARPDRKGLPEIDGNKIRLHLAPGESRLLQTSATTAFEAPPWKDFIAESALALIEGPWKLEFIDGGPVLPLSRDLPALGDWTSLGDAAKNFSGTARYTTTFRAPAGPAALDLGDLSATCRVTLNGKDLGMSFFPPHRFDASTALRSGENTLVVEVTNLAANRIADADRRQLPWKAFHEINFVNIDYQPFDASTWPAQASGLFGPVRLISLSEH
jgi:hypothetical protein